jgi:hypothetical protein
MEITTKTKQENLLLLAASSIFFFLSIEMISEFTSRLVRDILLNFVFEFYIIFVFEILIHLGLLILGILWLKNVLLRRNINNLKVFKYSIFALVFGEFLYIINPFLYHLFDMNEMNKLWDKYALIQSGSILLFSFKFFIEIFQYVFLGFIFYKNRNEFLQSS